jgi:hypothetical protein
MAVVATTTFAGGLFTGFLVDGSVSALNDYKERADRSCVPTKADPANIVAGDPAGVKASAATVAPAPGTLHSNNDVEWLISVAPGTSTQRMEIRNSDRSHGARMDFSAVEDGSMSPTASLWIAPSSIATIALPLGRYSTRVQLLDDDQRETGPVLPIIGGVNLSEPEELAVVAGSADGLWRVGGKAGARPVVKPSRPKGTKQSDEEYEGLGRGAEDEGTPTYG